MTIGRSTQIAAAAVCLLAIGTASALAQTADDLFDPDAVHDIRLYINSRDYRTLIERYEENTYYTADFVWRNLKVRNVGIRHRGVGSRTPIKPGLRVDFDRYVTGQRFLNLGAIALDNMWQDGSMIAERAAMSFLTRMGRPAPRETYGRLFINDVLQGLYTIIEPVDDNFLSRMFGSRDAYLFEYTLQNTWRGEYLGDELAPYKASFEAQTRELEPDTILYSPIRDLFREAAGPDDAVWRSRVEQYIDLSDLVTHVAIEQFLAEDDGFLGAFGMNNFFLYREPGSTVHRLIPWDKDSAFLDPRFSIFNRADENVLFTKALRFADLYSLYLDTLERCAREAAADGWLPGEVERLAALADRPTREDTLKQFSTEAFEGAVNLIRRFAVERPAYVLEAVARARDERR